MISISGRLPFSLGRLFGSTGPEVPDRLDTTVYPTVSIDQGPPENAFLRSERLWVGQSGPLGAAGNCPIMQLVNPAGSGILAIVEYLSVSVNTFLATMVAVMMTEPFWTEQSNNQGAKAWAADLRQNVAVTSSNQPQCRLIGSNVAVGGLPPASAYGPYYRPTAALGQPYIFPGPFILRPTDPALLSSGILSVFSNVAVTGIDVNIRWRERPFNNGELTV